MTKSKSTIERSIFTFLIVCLYLSLFGQFTSPSIGEIFRDDVVPRIDISIDPDSLAWILDEDNTASNYLFPATFIFNNNSIIDTIENIGFRLRGNTSRIAKKKSFKIDFNTYENGRQYYGLEKMNLNGQHNDPTISRAKICADLARALQIPSMRTNHVLLYINNDFYGVYLNVEHIDEEYVLKRFGNNDGNLYKCLYPADMKYKGSDPESYKEEFWGRRAYDLKTNHLEQDYSDLAEFIKILNTSSTTDLPCDLESIFNVDQYLRYIVFDILTGNWDGPLYNKNNFYLYHNTESELFEYLPYDLDNTLGIDWVSKDWAQRSIYAWKNDNETRPLYSRILSVQEYKDRFSMYMKMAIDHIFNEENLFDQIDFLEQNIQTFVEQDEYYPLDYGFSFTDFHDAFELELPYFQTDYGIKPFITQRKENATDEIVLNNYPPVINSVKNNFPRKFRKIRIRAQITDNSSISYAEICYRFNGSALSCDTLFDDGNHDDNEANDDIYGVILPATNDVGLFEYYISAKDDIDLVSRHPRCYYNTILIDDSNIKLAINEFLTSNTISVDENDQYEDWVEIYNYGDNEVFVGDKYLSDNKLQPNKWKMPNITIMPDEYLLFFCDKDGEQNKFHTNFKLNSGGEFIGIFDDFETGFDMIDGLEFGEQITNISYGRYPNGTGLFQALTPTPKSSNTILNSITHQAKINIFFSPNPTKDQLKIHTDSDERFTIEIYDQIGNKVIQKKNIYNKSSIKLNKLQSGIYFVKVINKEGKEMIMKMLKI